MQAPTASPDPDLVPSARPPPPYYGNTDPITTYITRVDWWYGPRDNPYTRTPIFHGQDVSNGCVYEYPGIVITTNSSGCRAIIGADKKGPPPDGWRTATWLYPDILFRIGDRCDNNYDE